MLQLRKSYSLPLSMPAVVGEISGSKMNPLPVIIFLIKCLARSIFNFEEEEHHSKMNGLF